MDEPVHSLKSGTRCKEVRDAVKITHRHLFNGCDHSLTDRADGSAQPTLAITRRLRRVGEVEHEVIVRRKATREQPPHEAHLDKVRPAWWLRALARKK